MNRGTYDLVSDETGVPRRRGDEPAKATTKAKATTRSPQARG